MRPVFKFGWLPENDYVQERPYAYPDIFALQKTSGPERLIIAPSAKHIALIFEILEVMQEPFGVLYVLAVPRSEGVEGRYQSAVPRSKSEVKAFLKRFKDFLENDGRHHLWISSLSTSDLLVFDNHNVIYAYGSLPAFEAVAAHRGLTKVDTVHIPDPHCHKYNEQFDQDQDGVMRYWNWKRFPLLDSD